MCSPVSSHEDIMAWGDFALCWPFVQVIYLFMVDSSTHNFDVFLVVSLKLLNKQSRCLWFTMSLHWCCIPGISCIWAWSSSKSNCYWLIALLQSHSSHDPPPPPPPPHTHTHTHTHPSALAMELLQSCAKLFHLDFVIISIIKIKYTYIDIYIILLDVFHHIIHPLGLVILGYFPNYSCLIPKRAAELSANTT